MPVCRVFTIRIIRDGFFYNIIVLYSLLLLLTDDQVSILKDRSFAFMVTIDYYFPVCKAGDSYFFTESSIILSTVFCVINTN